NVGTAALLLVVALAYFIWQFNPAFNLPAKKEQPLPAAQEAAGEQEEDDEQEDDKTGTGKAVLPPVIPVQEEKPVYDLKIIEKEEEPEDETVNEEPEEVPVVVSAPVQESRPPVVISQPPITADISGLELEIKTAPEITDDEGNEEKQVENLPPYEPTLDL